MVKRALNTLQHVSPRKTAEIIWYYFTQPGKVKFTPAQLDLVERADTFVSSYKGQKIVHYRWGSGGPKVLLCHGWRSKAADFRRMVEALVEAGYTVEGIDMPGHGKSEGKHTALPEFRDILKDHYTQHGPYEAIIGHSLGGLAAGMVAAELAADYQPSQLFLLSFPPYVRYFFHDIVKDLGYRDEVYEEFCKLVDKNYDQPIDYFDLRSKTIELSGINLHLVYDEQDATVPIERGREVLSHFPEAHFVHTKGLGHYKVMAYNEVIRYVVKNLKEVLEVKAT